MSTPQITRNGDELQALVQQGPEALRTTFVRIYNEAMKLERQQFLGAEPRKHNPQRRGRANGDQAKRLHTPAGRSPWPCRRPGIIRPASHSIPHPSPAGGG